MSKPIHRFYEKTKNTQLLLVIALLFIIIFLIAPLQINSTISFIGKFIILILLTYAVYQNFTETRQFSFEVKNDNTSSAKDLNNNIRLSYGLCVSMLLLLIYVLFSIFT